MKLGKFRILAISASFLAVAAACSSSDKDSVDLTTPWLGPLRGFERVSGEGNFGVFLKKTPGEATGFDRIDVTPPEIIVSAGSDLEAISPESYEKIKALFAEAFRRELAKQVPTATTDTERASASHVMQAALSNITITRKADNPNAATIDDLQFSFEGATIEAEIRIRKTNARSGAIVLPAKADNTGWEALGDPFAALARQAAAEVAKARSAIDTKAAQPPPAPEKPAEK